MLLRLRLKEPIRGYHERTLMGADEETALDRGGAGVAGRGVAHRSGRCARCAASGSRVPFIAHPAVALAPAAAALLRSEELGLNTAQRGLLAAVTEPFQIIGLFVGMPLAARCCAATPA